MRIRTKEEKRRIVAESFQSRPTVVSVARTHRVRPGQIFEWRGAYKEGRLTPESAAPALLPVQLSDVSGPSRPAPPPAPSNARVEIHESADPGSLGNVLEWLDQYFPISSAHTWIAAGDNDMRRSMHGLSALPSGDTQNQPLGDV